MNREAGADPGTPTVVPLLSGADRSTEGVEPPVFDAARRWADACLVARLVALDPVGLGGVHLEASPGPVRDQWLAELAGLLSPAPSDTATPPGLHRLPGHADESRLLGGLDVPATLASGTPVLQRGLLAELEGRILVCPMAERLPRRLLSHLCQALDHQEIRLEREGLSNTVSTRLAVVALDEADLAAEEAPLAPALGDRLAFRLNVRGIDWTTLGPQALDRAGLRRTSANGECADAGADVGEGADQGARWPASAHGLEAARALLPKVALNDTIVTVMVETALALGIESIRAPWWALQASRALAALSGRTAPSEADIVDAARLVLGPRARRLPPQQPAPESEQKDSEALESEPADGQGPEAPSPPAPPPNLSNTDTLTPPPPADAASAPVGEQQTPVEEMTVAAVAAAWPAGMLALLAQRNGLCPGLKRARDEASSRAGEQQGRGARGRPIGSRPGRPQDGQRVSLIDTLRQAVPWQRIRAAEGAPERSSARLHIRAADLRFVVREPRRPTTTIFVVDASGSNALNRLAEAKGAVETLLADCYVRRDRVSVLGFRGTTAETLLPPTRSLVRAKRSLAGLPGGGGTPTARALVEARTLCETLRRRGDTVNLVLLTDGKSNINREGRPGREQAHADAIQSARELAASGVRSLLVDTSPKPQALARELALAMGARYIPLPQARQGELGRVVRQSLQTN